MNLSAIKNVVTSKVGLKVLASKQHTPTVLFGVGVVGVVGTAVLASRATLQLDDTLKQFEHDKTRIVRARSEHSDIYTDAQAKSDGLIIRTKLATSVLKLYWPAIGLGALSIAALTGSHVILTRRNAGLAAAYTAIDRAFKDYRGRVKAELGDEKDKEFMFGSNEREVLYEAENGEPKTEVIKTHGDGRSPYAVVFDNTNLNWQPTDSYNAFFLRQVQNHLNDRLRSRGHVFLNEVYRDLGMEDTTAGAVTGWIWDSENGDNFIDFGVWDKGDLDSLDRFMTGKDGSILLDFNVDGVIYRDIEKKD